MHLFIIISTSLISVLVIIISIYKKSLFQIFISLTIFFIFICFIHAINNNWINHNHSYFEQFFYNVIFFNIPFLLLYSLPIVSISWAINYFFLKAEYFITLMLICQSIAAYLNTIYPFNVQFVHTWIFGVLAFIFIGGLHRLAGKAFNPNDPD